MTNTLDILRQLASFGTLDDSHVASGLSVGLSGFIARWHRETLPFVAAGGAELRFVVGPYGRGKTHFLQALEVSAQCAGFATSRVQCGMQRQPFASLAETYRAVADNIGFTNVQTNGKSCGLAEVVGGAGAEQLRSFQEAARANPGFRNLVAAYAKRIHSGQLHDPVTAGLRALLHHDSSQRVTFGELFRLERNLPRPLGRLGKRNAAVWLRSLLALPRQLGFKGLVVLFDETGADLHLRPEPLRTRQQHMANLRNLVDHLATGGTPGCSIVYATTNDFIQMAREDYPAMSQRIEPLEEISFKRPTRNPRAIWCRLNDLTEPDPDCAAFFLELGEKLLTFANEAPVDVAVIESVRRRLPALAEDMAQNLTQGKVREFMKRTASEILRST